MLTETLKELCALSGVSSHEDEVRAYVRSVEILQKRQEHGLMSMRLG